MNNSLFQVDHHSCCFGQKPSSTSSLVTGAVFFLYAPVETKPVLFDNMTMPVIQDAALERVM